MEASELIDKRITELGDWRGEKFAQIRKLVRQAAPEIVESWKWDTPVWTHNGNVLAVGAFQDHVKINFFYGALLEDHHLFNAGLEAKTSRGIDLRENDKIDEAALKKLIRSAVELNDANSKPAAKKKTTSTRKTRKAR
mgnify:CR=1 FL=1